MKQALFFLLGVCLVGCQKEISIEIPGTPPIPDTVRVNASPLLKKMTTRNLVSGFDYMIQELTYDDSSRLSAVKETFRTRQQAVTVESITQYRFNRDKKGRITDIQSVRDTVSMLYAMVYQDGSSGAIREILSYRQRGTNKQLLSKTTHTHNGAGRIEKISRFMPDINGTLQEVQYFQMKYDAKGNLMEQAHFSDVNGSGIWEPSIRYTWTHDDQTNPRFFPEEALYFWGYYWTTAMSPANITRHLNHYPARPVDEVTYKLQFNSRGNLFIEQFTTPDNTMQVTYEYE
jgi:hypothetical protein